MSAGFSAGGGALGPGRRFLWVELVVIGSFILLVGRLWQLQVMAGDQHFRRSTENFVKEYDLPASRGRVLDWRGRVLADNRVAFHAAVTPRYVTEESLTRLFELLRTEPEARQQIRARIGDKKGLERNRQIIVIEDLSRDQMVQIESERAFLPGVAVVSVERRSYPNGPLASHVIGYLGQISAEELVERRAAGYTPSDLIGRSGLERQWENYLRGKDGFERVIVDARGQRKSESLIELDEGPQRIEPRPGYNLVSTIDIDLQKATERALQRHLSGAAVVVEVHTGRVLAMASWPAADPNRLSARISRDELERLQNDKQRRPLLDKVVRENYFPGSTFKIIPALAALADGWLDPSVRHQCRASFTYGGRAFHCVEAHGKVNLVDALAASCNIYFYQLGDRLGIDRMGELAREFGFGATTGLGINGEVPGYVPTMTDLKKRGYQKGMALITAIGQESVKATLLQVAMAYAAVATSGDLYVPMLLDRIESPSGEVVQEFAPKLRHHIAQPERFWQLVRRGLYEAIFDKKGTAWEARVPGLDVAGKTGTAQVANRRIRASEGDERADHAWFASYGPADKPEVAVVTLIEHGGFGAKAATPVAMEIYKAYFRLQREGRWSKSGKPGSAP